MHDLVPDFRIVQFDRAASAQNGCVVEKPVDPVEVVFNGHGQLFILLHRGAFKIQRYDGWFGMTGRFDLIVDGFQFGDGAADENDGSAVSRIGLCCSPSYPAAGTGHHDDAFFQ